MRENGELFVEWGRFSLANRMHIYHSTCYKLQITAVLNVPCLFVKAEGEDIVALGVEEEITVFPVPVAVVRVFERHKLNLDCGGGVTWRRQLERHHNKKAATVPFSTRGGVSCYIADVAGVVFSWTQPC